MGRPSESRPGRGWIGRAGRWGVSLLTTLTLWAYFTAGFVLLFGPFYLWAATCAEDRVARFRRLNSQFYRGFFGLARRLMPGWRWRIDPRVRRLAGCLLVSNHLSYIDSILLISLFGRHTTIAKARLFTIPIFGRMLRASGYLPSSAEGDLAGLMVERMETLPAELAAGANLIVFPEGTRSRDGQIGAFHRSVFKIARRLGRPIQVLAVDGSDRLFRPGRFVFNALDRGTVSVDWIGAVAPPTAAGGREAVAAMMTETRRLLENRLQPGDKQTPKNGTPGQRTHS
jgi:1-acyl-sn-glycerol-3-phosphate acyltransferase